MKKRKIGISLIVLVITIVVVVVLATAVILSISRNNPIENAKKATFLNDMTALKDELSMYITSKMLDTSNKYDSSLLSADKYTLYENNKKVDQKTIKDVLPSIKDKYKDKVEIQNGKLQYVDTNNMEEYNWAKESLEGVSSNLDKVSNENSSTVEISNATEGNLENLKIYGNTIDNSSVGDYEVTEKKYKIPVTVSGKNLFDISKITTFKDWDYSGSRDTYSSITNKIITSNRGQYSSNALLYDSKITLPSGTYTISAEFMADKDSGNKGIVIGIRNFSTDRATKYYTLSGYRKWEKFSHTFTLDEETDIAVITQGTGQKDDYMNLNIKIKNIQLEVGDKATEYKEYNKEVYNIYLDEPLRKKVDAVDYIDLKQGKVVRNVKEENGVLRKLETPKIESIDLPDIITKSGTNILTVGTNVSPSKIEAIYNKGK